MVQQFMSGCCDEIQNTQLYLYDYLDESNGTRVSYSDLLLKIWTRRGEEKRTGNEKEQIFLEGNRYSLLVRPT